MCTQKIEIKLKPNTDAKNLWKMPKQMISIYQRNGQPYMMAKCGLCDECRLERVRNWTYKIFLESLSYNQSCFLTLTYADNEKGKNLNKNDLVKFIKRLRKKGKVFKYFGAGEYGTKRGRAHYHIILLGYYPEDTRQLHGTRSNKGKLLYTSKIIHNTWGLGRITVQPFGKDEISYITLYTNKNKIINQNENKSQVIDFKHQLNELKLKYNLVIKTISRKGNIIYTKTKLLKDLEIEKHKAYKKEYRTIKKSINLNKEHEFNIYSKGMGYQNFIKKQYYKYELIIDKFKYETPKEYLIKTLDQTNDIETINYITEKLLKRKKHAEENYIDTKDMEQLKALRLEEQAKANRIKNKIKENRTQETRTF